MVDTRGDLNLFRSALEDAERREARRSLLPLQGLPGKRILRGDRPCLNLGSNNYLGLADHPAVRRAAADAALRFGAGAGGSRLLGGNLPIHAQLEAAVTRMRPLGGALLFNTGYMANLGVLQALAPLLGPVFSDKLNHASMADGLRPSSGSFHRYRHGDMAHLESLLAAHAGQGRPGSAQGRSQPLAPESRKPGLVCSETLFSMDGDFAPLEGLLALQRRYGFFLFLDEAHSTGCYPGFPAPAMAADPDHLVIMGTFGKAFGGFGAYVAAPAPVIDYLINAARSFIFSTAQPPAVAGAALASLETAEAEAWRREKLEELSARARESFRARGLDTGSAAGHILPVMAGTNRRAVRFSEAMYQAGYHAPPIRHPTVPAGRARLRINLTCEWDMPEVAALAEALEKARDAIDADSPAPETEKGETADA